MTEEERQNLVKWLRFVEDEHWWADNCGLAADEIERLSESVQFWQKESAKWAEGFAAYRRRYEDVAGVPKQS
jgi:hypothetical protein